MNTITIDIDYVLEQCSVRHLGMMRFDGVEYHECVDLDRLKFLLENEKRLLNGQRLEIV